jgi:uncharacterized protein DUF1706
VTAAPARARKADIERAIREQADRLAALATGPRASEVVAGTWTARDILAHAVYWQAMLARMMGSPLHAPGWIPRGTDEHELGTDELNRLAVEHYRDIADETLLRDFTFTAELVTRIVRDMKEENLALEAGTPWPAGTTVAKAIEGETYGHWREHADEIEAARR